MPTNRSLPWTPLALAVLITLVEKPMHPYEMKLQMRDRGQDRVGSGSASLYDTVARLAKNGYIEPLETSREGKRPERTTYQITEFGTDELREWLRELVAVPSRDLPPFSTALMFIAALRDKTEVLALLQTREVTLESEIAAAETMLKAMVEERQLPRLFVLEDEFATALKRCELDWVRALAKDLQTGALPWPVFPEDGGPPHM
jgi:DNA-binding PadR family transcriptional regulator